MNEIEARKTAEELVKTVEALIVQWDEAIKKTKTKSPEQPGPFIYVHEIIQTKYNTIGFLGWYLLLGYVATIRYSMGKVPEGEYQLIRTELMNMSQKLFAFTKPPEGHG